MNAGGLVIEVGGVMNHGSVVAREYGIPAVVGLKMLLKKLRSGQQVCINGNTGIIEIFWNTLHNFFCVALSVDSCMNIFISSR
ncbi:MAG: PEP-utilizing enzyme, partial [Spirochaetes bacterium]|nr:PEP-utilizing enzyme [Spirochaetota bacterium]